MGLKACSIVFEEAIIILICVCFFVSFEAQVGMDWITIFCKQFAVQGASLFPTEENHPFFYPFNFVLAKDWTVIPIFSNS